MASNVVPSTIPNCNVNVTIEDFKLFHSIDRQLFTRLVVGLGREISQSTNVMAFIMWIENKSKNYSLVVNILQIWSDDKLSKLVEEAVVVLNCIESSCYPDVSPSQRNLALIQNVLRHNVTLEYFHEKRFEVLHEVTKFVNDVCLIAFEDIIEKMHQERTKDDQELYLTNLYGDANHQMQRQIEYYAPNEVPMVPQQIIVAPSQFNALGSTNASTETNSYNVSRHVADRTIFITFSNHDPMSENELRQFFTRNFGDIIDRLNVQYVRTLYGLDEPMYARLVVRSEAVDVIAQFLENKPRKNFYINGKNVWVTNFTRKEPKSCEAAGTSKYFP